MVAEYESCRARLSELVASESAVSEDRNEATTRLHLIDTLFFECLGWEKKDCEAEERLSNEYTDYTFSLNARVLIVEAKREGKYFELPAGAVVGERSIPSLCRDSRTIESALEQAASYCQQRGVPIGAISNGHQLVAFLASRNDGFAPLQGRALVFPSLSDMFGSFRELWDALSRSGIVEGRLRARLARRPGSPLPPKLSASIPGYPGTKRRNVFQTDLQILSELVLEDLARNPAFEQTFLEHCYAKSGALSQYALISKRILEARYASLFSDTDHGPVVQPAVEKDGISAEIFGQSLSRRPILLIGDVGVGKTSFIRHLIKIDFPEVFTNAITLYLDLGSGGSLTQSLSDFILDDIEKQLHENHDVDTAEASFVEGVYHSDLARFRKGLYGSLKESDPDEYTRKKIQFLEKKLSNKGEHLRRSIEHLEKARRKQIILFLDNADQRAAETQQAAFLIAQEVAEQWPITVFLALRPETFYASLREGALSGYHPKAFTISPPRVDVVLDKRLALAIKIAQGDIPVSSLRAKTKYSFQNLAGILEAFQTSLYRNQDLIEAIDNLASGNVRRALDFVKTFLGSGHVDTEKISRIVAEQGSYLVPLHEFLRAVIYGDNAYYDPMRSPVANLFDLSAPERSEHFLSCILLQSLQTSPKRSDEGFLEVSELYRKLQDLGFLADQVEYGLQAAMANGTVELKGHAEPTASSQARLTPMGAYHVQRLVGLFVYVDAILVDVPVLDRQTRDGLRDVDYIKQRLDRAELFIDYLDMCWDESSIALDAFDWPTVAGKLRTEIDDVRRRTEN